MNWWDAVRRRRWWWIGLAVVVVVAGTLIGLALQSGDDSKVPIRAREYRAFTSCLLTDERGLAAQPATAVWAGMQDASLRNRTKVEYVVVVGDQSVANARTYLASLVQAKCGLVIAAGSLPTAAVEAGHADFPDAHFVVVSHGSTVAGVTTIDDHSASAVTNQIATMIFNVSGSAD